RTDRRYADQPVELAAEEGERGLNGGAGRGRAQLSGQIPAFRTAGGGSYPAIAPNCRCPDHSPSKHNTHIPAFEQRIRALRTLTGQEWYAATIGYIHTGSHGSREFSTARRTDGARFGDWTVSWPSPDKYRGSRRCR